MEKTLKNRQKFSFPGAMILRVLLLSGVTGMLSGCTIFADIGAKLGLYAPHPPAPRQDSLWTLSLYQGFDHWQMPYYNAIQPFAPTTPHSPDLALPRLALRVIPDSLGWLRDYDFDCDGALTSREMTQAWLIRTAEIKTGNTYGPYALLGPVRVAALNDPYAELARTTGISLPRSERTLVRAALDQHPDGKALSTAFDTFASQTHMHRDDGRDELGETPDDTPAQPHGPPGGGTPPGQGGTPPGQGGEPPGGGSPPGGTPPGQGGEPPGQGGGKPGKGGGKSERLPLPPSCLDRTFALNASEK